MTTTSQHAAEGRARGHSRGARRRRRRDHDDGDGARLDDDAAASARRRVRSVGDGSRHVARTRHRAGAAGAPSDRVQWRRVDAHEPRLARFDRRVGSDAISSSSFSTTGSTRSPAHSRRRRRIAWTSRRSRAAQDLRRSSSSSVARRMAREGRDHSERAGSGVRVAACRAGDRSSRSAVAGPRGGTSAPDWPTRFVLRLSSLLAERNASDRPPPRGVRGANRRPRQSSGTMSRSRRR